MNDFDMLEEEINRGITGKNSGIPIGFKRLNRYIGIRKRIYTLIFGSPGSGKSAYSQSAYILNPFDAYLKNREGIKFHVIFFCMERSKIYTIAKWVSRKIFLDNGILIPIAKMLGWWDTKLSKDEHDLVLLYREYVEELREVVDIYEGPRSPADIFRILKEYANEHGKEEQLSEFMKIYLPNKPDEIVIPIVDHLGLIKITKEYKSRKEVIDKTSEHLQYFRDFHGYSPVCVSQLTRNLSNPLYSKIDSFEPTIDDVKESGNPGEAADIITSLFDCLRFRTTDPVYEADKFVDTRTGAKHFRSIKVLKNTYGEDDIRIGMAFHGATGIFKELPKPSEMSGFEYNDIMDGSYYLTSS